MRDLVKDFLTICRDNLPLQGPIYEFGSKWAFPQGSYADLRPLFPDKQYIGCDISDGDGVDIILDIEDSHQLKRHLAGTIILADMLEHCKNPYLVFENANNMLKDGGFLLVTTVLDFVIHFDPDHWRFTPQGLGLLFDAYFDEWMVSYAGKDIFPHTVVGIGSVNTKFDILQPMLEWTKKWTPVQGG